MWRGNQVGISWESGRKEALELHPSLCGEEEGTNRV